MSNRKRRLVLVSHRTEAKTDKNGNLIIDANGEVQTWEIDVYKDLNDYHYVLHRYANGLEQEHYMGRQLPKEESRPLGRITGRGFTSGRWPAGKDDETVAKGWVPSDPIKAGLPVRTY